MNDDGRFLTLTPEEWTAVALSLEVALKSILFSLPIATQPLFVGKVSTLVQVLYIFATLLLLAFDLSAPRLTQLAAWACGLLTVLSGCAYGGLFLRGILTGNRVA